MGLFKYTLVAATLAVAAPVWANGGHGRGHGDHGGGHGPRHHAEWRDYRHHWRPRPHVVRRDYAPGPYYYAPPPAYAYAPPPTHAYAPAPGVHIVAPDIYIPLH